MPKAAKQTTHSKTSRTTPFSPSKPNPQNKTATPRKDPKNSHLYTDDNPSTTIHGTGFKDATTAHHTLALIQSRSLTYQFQTVNTMFHRASHHPAMKKQQQPATSSSSSSSGGNSQQGIKDAMAIFRHWLDETYPAAKSSLRAQGFKPLLSKDLVEKFLPRILSSSSSSGLDDNNADAAADAAADADADARTFAQRYVNLAKGKRLGNVLLDDSDPTGLDWEARRYRALCELVPEGKEKETGWGEGELWEDAEGDEGLERDGGGKKGKRKVSDRHLRLIAWAWSPVGERKLMQGLKM